MQPTTHPFTVVTPQLSLAREAIALELSIGTPSKALGFLPSFFGSVENVFKGFISRKFDFYKADHLRIEQEKILKKLESVNYARVAELQVAGLEGFQGTYLAYGRMILASFDYYKNCQAEIATYRRLLGDLVTNANAQLKLESRSALKRTERDIKGFDDEIGTLFARGSHIAQTTVEKVVPRYAELGEVFGVSQDVVAKIKELDPAVVKSQLQEINELIGLLVQAIEDGKLSDITGVQLTNLSDGVMSLAKQVEFFGLTYYRAVTYCAAIERLVDVLKKV